ncbi:bifunctional diguanylate cyclase/phosphodiesterase [Salinisphaera sp. Q1T1-3]|uniref:putative bifunctional diguanylate cyclase/phosphodiesterase n=1 Tax=Salinisphaera sp. Q1T1-3 TaxID=2321229 RepID=UPI000E744201|nr:EAL domain-containing protein [Salinisphaera sp. Q1T1-3]RJS92363.1 EAL domain-containing protein [Salinisphaera sp. Q1T1-3]
MENRKVSIRVLVVEDEELDRERVVRLLGGIPDTAYALTFAHDSVEAEAELARASHDICLLDYRLGAATGLDVLKSAACQLFAGPVVVLTGNDDRAIDLAVMHAGATDFVSKDALTSVRLERVIRYALAHCASQRRFEYLADHDQVTGLLNRRAIEQHIAKRVSAGSNAALTAKPFTVVYLDLDGFKGINDSLGHAVGDRALVIAAQRLRAGFGERAVLGRVGGDEFLAVLDETDRLAVDSMLARTLSRIREPMAIAAHRVQLSSSIGVARHPEDAGDGSHLIAHADAAMYAAKRAGRDRYRWFASSTQAQAGAESLTLGNELRRALAREELYLVYQPQFALGTGRIVGLEALVRWQHPRLGALAPTRFIALAAARGFLGLLSDWVLEAACRQYQAWRDYGLIEPDVVLGVNMPSELITGGTLVDSVQRVVTRRGIPRSCLALEFRQAAVAPGNPAFDSAASALQALGVGVVIDNVCCGDSSLTALHGRPADALKIDLGCLRGLDQDPRDQAMARSVISLGTRLGMRVVANGVENACQARFLADNHCDFAQGFLYAPGLATPDMTELLAGDMPNPLQARNGHVCLAR